MLAVRGVLSGRDLSVREVPRRGVAAPQVLTLAVQLDARVLQRHLENNGRAALFDIM